MNSLLNSNRPLFFCPGCSHDRVVHGVDKAIQCMGLKGDEVAIVSDIGCSGLFDTFFNTHALHGLHGRALTYATGLKMVRPELTVLVIMGDGGLGIGGAHVLASCRRNLDITLLVLNNFNYGMTGGQCSTTTPSSDHTASNFLNKLEVPIDICRVAVAAGAEFAEKVMATESGLAEAIVRSVQFPGFSLLDIWGICPGRHLKKNPITLDQLEKKMKSLDGVYMGQHKEITEENNSTPARSEYGEHYRRLAADAKQAPPPLEVEKKFAPLVHGRTEVVILGAAGQFINTVGEILSIAAMSTGLSVSQKNDYPITVLRGHSIAEVVIDTKSVTYTGIEKPAIIICVGQEGIDRRKNLFSGVDAATVIVTFADLKLPELPSAQARVILCNGGEPNLKKAQRGIAALATLAKLDLVLDQTILKNAINIRYSGKMADESLLVVEKTTTSSIVS